MKVTRSQPQPVFAVGHDVLFQNEPPALLGNTLGRWIEATGVWSLNSPWLRPQTELESPSNSLDPQALAEARRLSIRSP